MSVPLPATFPRTLKRPVVAFVSTLVHGSISSKPLKFGYGDVPDSCLLQHLDHDLTHGRELLPKLLQDRLYKAALPGEIDVWHFSLSWIANNKEEGKNKESKKGREKVRNTKQQKHRSTERREDRKKGNQVDKKTPWNRTTQKGIPDNQKDRTPKERKRDNTARSTSHHTPHHTQWHSQLYDCPATFARQSWLAFRVSKGGTAQLALVRNVRGLMRVRRFCSVDCSRCNRKQTASLSDSGTTATSKTFTSIQMSAAMSMCWSTGFICNNLGHRSNTSG